MNFSFGILEFEVANNKVFLSKIGDKVLSGKKGFLDVDICGETETTQYKRSHSVCGKHFQYVHHELKNSQLEILQKTDKIKATTVFTKYENCKTVRVRTTIENITETEVILNTVSAFSLYGFGHRDKDLLYYTRFHQTRYAECQPIKNSFEQLGFFAFEGPDGQTKIFGGNKGNCSCREEIPQGIIENKTDGDFYMFALESNHLWYYEISERYTEYYLHLGGADLVNCGWQKVLKPKESYTTIWVALTQGKSEEFVLQDMTKYRRNIAGKCVAEEDLPPIFNEYMHLAWDNPYWENTQKYAPIVAKTGVKYYVIDCGWHTQFLELEEDPYKVYSYIGDWTESLLRFPNGLADLSKYLGDMGMKLGLWIAPEQVGVNCASVIEKLGEDCFLQRNGKLLRMNTNYMLDYRKDKVRAHMDEVIRRMVEDYNVGYIKFDCTAGHYLGEDGKNKPFGLGIEENANAFADWVIRQREKYPQVVFEACAGGGMRMDYRWLSIFSLVSTSDQINYLKYPYLVCNLLSAVLPEQCAVWSYPVTEDCEGQDVTDERICMNMVNSLLGRIHLASHLERLDERQLSFVREGIEYYKSITEAKKNGLPKFPLGFGRFSKDFLCAGFETEDKLYLAVWNMGDDLHREIPLNGYKSAKCAYPSWNKLPFTYQNNKLTIEFTQKYQARFFEIER